MFQLKEFNLPMNVDSVTDLINKTAEFNYKYTVDDSIELIPDAHMIRL